MALSAFGQAYSDALKDLTSAELAKIKLLRDLAKENPGEAFNIMQALVKHAYECPEVHRLPALYLMDCMLKSADAPYPELLAGVIVEVFAFIWDGARPDIRSKLARMAGTWRHPVPFLPADVMAAITQKMQPPQAAPLQPAPLQQQSLVYPGQLLAPTVAQAAPNVPAVAVPGSLPPHLQQQFGQPATTVAPYGPVAMADRPGAGYAPVQHMPPFTQGLQAAYGGPTLAVAPAAVAAVPAPAVNQAVPSAAGMASLLSSLGAFAASAAAAAPVRSAGSSGGGSGGSAQQDKAQAAVDALFAASDLTKRKFLDLQFLRNRRLQASTYLVRPWFVKIEQWLEGTRTAEEAPAHFFEEPSQPKELPPVEEDPSQPTCAISGEAFDRTYDPDTDKWYYDDAVVLTAEQAAAYGVMEGSIVKSSCLAGAPPAVLVAQGIQGSSAAQYTNKTRTPDAPVGQTVSATPSPPGKRAYADAKPLGVQQPDLKRIRVDG